MLAQSLGDRVLGQSVAESPIARHGAYDMVDRARLAFVSHEAILAD